MAMSDGDELYRLVELEWAAQEIVVKFKDVGPAITPVLSLKKPVNSDTIKNILAMQGSFDPITCAHLEILKKAIDSFFKNNSLSPSQVEVFLLLSMSHVEKQVDVRTRSLFGHRVEMIVESLKETINSSKVPNGLPFTIAFSNVARYVDLVDAFQNYYHNRQINVSFIMGMDVFRKIFDCRFYSEPLQKLYPHIFNASYYVANREDIETFDDFNDFILKQNLSEVYRKKIFFVQLPVKLKPMSSTLVRQSLMLKQSIPTGVLSSGVVDYLLKRKLYQQNDQSIVLRILVQKGVQLGIQQQKDIQETFVFIKSLFNELISDKGTFEQIILDYSNGHNQLIKEKWRSFFHNF